jgi:hypothetical protein
MEELPRIRALPQDLPKPSLRSHAVSLPKPHFRFFPIRDYPRIVVGCLVRLEAEASRQLDARASL